MATDDRGPQIKATAILFLTTSWIFVSLRCYVRIFVVHGFGIDDWLAVTTLLVFTLFCAVVLLGEATGTGRHSWEISPDDMSKSLMWWYCGEVTYALSTWLIKLCIATYLMKICGVKRYQSRILWAVIIIFTTYTIFYTFFMAFQCHPVSYFWTKVLPPPNTTTGSCLDPSVITFATYAHSALTLVADWTLGTLPIFLVWNMPLDRRTKVLAAFILGLGAIGSIATIIRIPFIYQLSTRSDFLYINTDVSIWSTVEPGVGLMAASMACLKPMFRSFFARSTPAATPAAGKANEDSSRRSNRRRGRDTSYTEIESPTARSKDILDVTVLEMESASRTAD